MNDPTEVTSGVELLKLDSSEAGKRMDALSPQVQRELVLQIPPGRRRQDLILLSGQPEVLTRILPPEDLVLTIKEIGDQDALPLVEMSSNAQLDYLLDLDIWFKYDLDFASLDHWLAILLECGDERTTRWLATCDFELLVLLFERSLLLVDRETLNDLPDALGGRVVTPDDYHYLVVKLGSNYELMSAVVKLLYTSNQERFLAVTGNLGTTPPAELEELTLRWRTGRLADRGWPDLDEAHAFYQPRDPAGQAGAMRLPDSLVNPPRYPLERLEPGRLFPAGLAMLVDATLLEAAASQLANLINRVVIGDGLPPGEIESLSAAAERVAGRLEIGLAELGARSPQDVARVLQTTPLLHIAQIGQRAIVTRRKRAIRIREASGGLWSTLRAPIPSRLELLTRHRSLYLEADGELPRELSSSQDLLALDRDMDLTEAGLLLAQSLGLSVKSLPEPFPEGCIPADLETTTLQTLLLTAYARQRLGEAVFLGPLPESRLPELLGGIPVELNGIREQLVTWVASLIPDTGSGTQALLDDLAGHLAEWKAHDPARVDPRYMEGLWLQLESRE